MTAGDGLSGGGEGDLGASITLAASVDDSSIEVSGGDLQVKASGITNAMLAGSIANAKLVNDSVTVTAGTGLKDGGEVDLGSSVTVNVDESSSLTWSGGVQKFDTEVLRIAGTNTDSGTKKAFSLRVEGGILILEDKGNF